MQRTLELVESQVSARSRWHVLMRRHGDLVAGGGALDVGAPLTGTGIETGGWQRLRGRTRDGLEAVS